MTEVRHLRALQAFDKAASHASLSEAAQALGVTHGAVSRQIKQLEQYVGASLLVRHATGVQKTAAGERLHAATRQAFSALEIGLRNVRRSPNDRSVTVSLSSSFAIKWLVPKLAAFRAANPDITLFLDTNDDIVDFGTSEVDVALRYGIPSWGDLFCERLYDEDLIVVAAPSLVEGRRLPLKPEAIARLPLLHDEFNSAWAAWAQTVGLETSRLAKADFSIGDSAVLIAAVIDGQGAGLVRRALAEDDLKAERIIQLHPTPVSLDRALYFVCRTGEQNRPAIGAFRSWLFSIGAEDE